MKMTKCYTNIFTEPLEKLGFKKYGVLYCRAMGEILQGITLRTTNPGEVCFAFYPMRNHRFMCENSAHLDIKKGLWAEKSTITGFHYFSQSKPEESESIVHRWLDTVMNEVIPVLDYADSFERYIEKVTAFTVRDAERKMAEPDTEIGNISDMEGEIMFGQTIHENDLLWMAHIDGSFERSNTVFECAKNESRVYSLKNNRKNRADIMLENKRAEEERFGKSDDPFGMEEYFFKERLKNAFQTEEEVQEATNAETERIMAYRYPNYIKAAAEGNCDMINSIITDDDLKFRTLKDGIELYCK